MPRLARERGLDPAPGEFPVFGAPAVSAGISASLRLHRAGERKDERPRSGASPLCRLSKPARGDPQAPGQRGYLSGASHRRGGSGEPVPAALRGASLQPDLRGAQRRSPVLLEDPALMGPAGRGSRSTRDGRPRRSRDRGGVRVPERSSQGPDRQGALETARDRRAFEAVPACAFLPHHRHASARWHAAPERSPDGRGAAAPAVARALGDGEPGGQRRPSCLRSDGRQRPHHGHRRANAPGRGEKRHHGENDGENGGFPRRGNLARGRLVHAPVRAPPDGGDRPGDRRDRRPHVHADLRACRESEMSLAETASISSREIEEARSAAAAARRRLVEVLEAKLGLDPDVFVARLGATLRIQVMRMEELRSAAPAFDVLPFSEGSQRGCALLRGEHGALWLVTDDPFSGEQQAWAEERISQEFSWRLVHRGDLVAFLASHEETLRALDAVRAGATVVSEETRGIEDLSLKAISEESSEVVRLVRSTLRDALMIGASDIHLETIAAGAGVKVRLDGNLSPNKFIQDTKQAEQAIFKGEGLPRARNHQARGPPGGRLQALDRGRAVDFRVSIMPNIYGEDAVLRVLDKQALYESTQQQLSLDSLGFETDDIRALRRLSQDRKSTRLNSSHLVISYAVFCLKKKKPSY